MRHPDVPRHALSFQTSHRRGLPAPPTASFTTILRGSVRWTKYNGSGHRLAIDTGFLRPQQRLSPPPTWICLLDQAQRLWTPPSSLNNPSTTLSVGARFLRLHRPCTIALDATLTFQSRYILPTLHTSLDLLPPL
ncbi:hypothetical protein DEU56DRAFT_919079 [Suillus clintonianus]|uniref:uncharacterized protein n=1 Tax=Suillus clintonianus TaxID=1904413 RepID=UPI001B8871DD|nr:uncharacterized protein DEU56DRAFT_919552 [Suillus clintonianus]XP_041201981.1 uncharacterized protein DEU56DRAFT_919079 [Suillus clintonianus]KAG2114528.1 hypothetical protein DEU56DRAFT_919552 [Suillus clintonianus]KAG2117476.1 hypothetical protein DEU56DRAFT_919079 [Suillus clintonianus]